MINSDNLINEFAEKPTKKSFHLSRYDINSVTVDCIIQNLTPKVCLCSLCVYVVTHVLLLSLLHSKRNKIFLKAKL
jgi:ADP-glucose pyrophosphorylase